MAVVHGIGVFFSVFLPFFLLFSFFPNSLHGIGVFCVDVSRCEMW